MVRSLLAFVIGVSTAIMPAYASETVTQTIALPTFDSPALARIAYQNGGNGVLGYVFRVDARTHKFSLENVDTGPAASDFDIFFYASIDSVSDAPLDPQYLNAGPKSGPIPNGAVWAVVTSSTGARQTFRYSAS